MSEVDRAWVALNLVPMSPRVRWRLAEACGGPASVFSSRRERLREILSHRPEIADKIIDINWMPKASLEIANAKKRNIHILTPSMHMYPNALRELNDPPTALYVRGELIEEDALAVAIVGSRAATEYGLCTASLLGRGLSERGITVISGLALGADAAAHRGALEGGGRTLAILGSGIDVIYPRRHWRLYEKVAERGAVISEFPLGTSPTRWTFPQRNRLIAALSLATVVVEAAERSGSLITADFATDLGRVVCAVPGRVTASRSHGTNALIRDGAALVRDANDIIEGLPVDWRDQVLPASERIDPEALGLNPAEARVLSQVGADEPVHLDALAKRSGIDQAPLLSILLALEFRRLVRPVPGGRFLRAANLPGAGQQTSLFSES
jgi:DNA processing protein